MSVETAFLLVKLNQYIKQLQTCRQKVVNDEEELNKYFTYIRMLRTFRDKLHKPLPLTELNNPDESKVLQSNALDSLEDKLTRLKIRQVDEPNNENIRQLISRVEKRIAKHYEEKFGLVTETKVERKTDDARKEEERQKLREQINRLKHFDNEHKTQVQKEKIRLAIDRLEQQLLNTVLDAPLDLGDEKRNTSEEEKQRLQALNDLSNINASKDSRVKFYLTENAIQRIYIREQTKMLNLIENEQKEQKQKERKERKEQDQKDYYTPVWPGNADFIDMITNISSIRHTLIEEENLLLNIASSMIEESKRVKRSSNSLYQQDVQKYVEELINYIYDRDNAYQSLDSVTDHIKPRSMVKEIILVLLRKLFPSRGIFRRAFEQVASRFQNNSSEIERTKEVLTKLINVIPENEQSLDEIPSFINKAIRRIRGGTDVSEQIRNHLQGMKESYGKANNEM